MAEASNARLTRLLTLVPWLAQHSGISKQEAAAHFGMTVAALEADLELITVTGPGLFGGDLVDITFEDETVTVYDAQGLVEPLRLTAEESSALLLGLHALQQLPDVDAAVVAGLIEKLGERNDAALEVQVSSGPYVTRISEAIATGQDIRLQYLHPVRDDRSDRVVTPVNLITRDGVDYLLGWCHLVQTYRTFRLDRVQGCEMVGPAAAAANPPGELDRPSNQATVVLPAALEYLLESVPARIEQRGSELVASIDFGDDAWLVGWLVGCGTQVRCLTPERIAHSVAQKRADSRAAYAALALAQGAGH
ncbi:MAG: WYL domain-containing protein [Candidatus Nanopelagicales bacterium]